jgi:hypothetical protein
MISNERAEELAYEAIKDYLVACSAETDLDKTIVLSKLISVSALGVKEFSGFGIAVHALKMTENLISEGARVH